jgi:hypothetical protein
MTGQPSTTHPTATHTAAPATADAVHRHLRPVPFGRLVDVHLRIWRAQRGIVVGLLLILTAGLLSTAGMLASMDGRPTGATLAARLGGVPVVAFTLLWLAVGAVAGAAPFKSRWSVVVLAVAPRRGRWLAACLVSFLLAAAAVTGAFLVSAAVVTAAVLAAKGHDPGLVLDLGRPARSVLVLSGAQALLGFLLGAATRSVAASIIVGYVIAPVLPLLRAGSVALGRWLDINSATGALAVGDAPGRSVLPIVVALLVWVSVPALIAWARLRSSVG